MDNRKWKFRNDMLNHYINCVSSRTFQDVEDRLNYLEAKEQLPDMREKVKEYISELDKETDRLDKILEDMISEPEKGTAEQRQKDKIDYENIKSRAQTLMEVKNDLQSRLEELV